MRVRVAMDLGHAGYLYTININRSLQICVESPLEKSCVYLGRSALPRTTSATSQLHVTNLKLPTS